jgi:hypothetical protein
LQSGILSTSRDALYSKAVTSKNLESSQGDENIQTTRTHSQGPDIDTHALGIFLINLLVCTGVS